MLTTRSKHSPGVLIEGVSRPRRSAVLRIVAHDGLWFMEVGSDTVFISTPEARVVWCGYYCLDILRNGWQPFDQPDPAAYMPLSYQRLDRVDLRGAGAFFVQAEPSLETVRSLSVDDGDTRRIELLPLESSRRLVERVVKMLDTAGVPDIFFAQCCRIFAERVKQMFPISAN